jgi:phosphatidylglycerol lysyltransferase
MRHGWNATSYQIVNPGIHHWFSERGDAVVGYVPHSRIRVVAGAPVCSTNRIAEVAAEFERDAKRASEGVCYFGAEERLETAIRESPRYSLALLGAQPEWELSEWIASVESYASLRAQFNRAKNKGVTIEEWPSTRAAASRELKKVLERWLQTRKLPPLHFLIEPETLERLDDRRIFVATRKNEGIVAFAVLSPIPARAGWLVEQFPRVPAAPNGTIELLLRAAARAVATGGGHILTLGLAPLAKRDTMRPEESAWLHATLTLLRAHGRRFYNFEGLEKFKSKFHPQSWKPVYAIQNSPRFSPRALYAIAGAFASRSPVKLVASALLGVRSTRAI